MDVSDGRRVLITGATGGLGLALADALTAAGDRVLRTDLAAAGPEPYQRLDVRSAEDWTAARDLIVEQWGGLDVLVNNAGIAGGGRLDRAPVEEWRRLIDVNLLGIVQGISIFLPMFKEQRSGTVVNVASLAGLVHPAGLGAYSASKAAVVALSETLSHEGAGYGVRCVVVCPSYFRTGLLASLQGADPAVTTVISRLVETADLGAEDIAAAVVAALDGGPDLVLPDPAARAAYALKVQDPEEYSRTMRQQAAKLDQWS